MWCILWGLGTTFLFGVAVGLAEVCYENKQKISALLAFLRGLKQPEDTGPHIARTDASPAEFGQFRQSLADKILSWADNLSRAPEVKSDPQPGATQSDPNAKDTQPTHD